jgi:uncharacterized membrane protein
MPKTNFLLEFFEALLEMLQAGICNFWLLNFWFIKICVVGLESGTGRTP